RHQQCVGCEVHIRLKNSTAVGGIIEGQVAHFFVDVPCIAKEYLTYHWTVSSGGIAINGDALPDFFVRMPSSPNIVTVTATVTVINPREVQISTIVTCQSIRDQDVES